MTMKKIGELSPTVKNWLEEIPPCQWFMWAFDPRIKSEHVTNGTIT